MNNKEDYGSCCPFVEWDDIGNEKSCPNTKLEEFKKQENREFCKLCLEGQKVDALNTINSLFFGRNGKADAIPIRIIEE